LLILFSILVSRLEQLVNQTLALASASQSLDRIYIEILPPRPLKKGNHNLRSILRSQPRVGKNQTSILVYGTRGL
jgi:hypothetical protein